MKKRLFSALALCLLLATLCGCAPPMPTISTTPISDDSPPTPNANPVPIEPGTLLTLSELIGYVDRTIAWSTLKNYEHTQEDGVTAVFPVSDGAGKTCTLKVTFDDVADNVTEATLSYNDVSINILTDDTMIIREIMRAMDEG